jgi:origin recognition complex subunit 4
MLRKRKSSMEDEALVDDVDPNVVLDRFFGPVSSRITKRIVAKTIQETPRTRRIVQQMQHHSVPKIVQLPETPPSPPEPVEWTDKDVQFIKRCLAEQFNGSAEPLQLVGLSAEEDQLYALLDHCIAHGESNSALLIGPRGSGKSMLVKRTLRRLKYRYLDKRVRAKNPFCDTPSPTCEPSSQRMTDPFFVVKLNAFAQVDDRAAIRELARQLAVNDELQNSTKGFVRHLCMY